MSDNIINELSLKKASTSGALIIGLAGFILTDSEIISLKQVMVVGVILFSRNYANREQLLKLTISIKQINPDLIICVDHEGGRVQRFREGFTDLPNMRSIGEYYQQDQALAIKKAYSIGVIIGIELISTGVDFSFTPVCDLDFKVNAAIGDRAFDGNPNAVSSLVCALHNGLKSTGSIGIAKHFPGHGFVASDSHLETPHDTRPFKVIKNNDIVPFKALIEQKIEGIMPAHIIYTDFDNEHTAVSSEKWINYLKADLGFKGIVFSDDLDMEGAKSLGDAAYRANLCFSAGVDILLCCNNVATTAAILGNCAENYAPNLALQAKILGLKAKQSYSFDFTQNNIWQEAYNIVFDLH
ncbi:beta N-acetyl-glucosaminidase [Gammaproteobacteria bacterium]|nr:beta N-acetyl-glucosaminidase [Gammaproteobacteria bacterium]